MTDQSRDAFEAWAQNEGINSFHYQHCFDAWQAATAAERERCAKEAEHWQTISTTPGHACGQYIAAAIRQPLPTGTGGMKP